MSLIFIRENTLNDTAVIALEFGSGDIKETQMGDLTIIKSADIVVGLNINNFKKYFNAKEGVHTINTDQVEAIKKLGYEIQDFKSKFLIGEVMSASPHPKSEKLQVLNIKASKDLTIVTNDLTVKPGEKIVVATLGAILPSGKAIVPSKVMGVDSEGMLCGGETLGQEKTNGVKRVSGNIGDEYIL